MAIDKVTSASITDSAVTDAKLSFNANQFRNIIINGDMSIAQRTTSTASITSTGYHTLDRFQTLITSLGTWTQSQSTDVRTVEGFATSLKMDCTTADASPAASDELLIRQRFEGQNLQYLKKGTSSAESLTLSFWVRSNKTGTYIAELFDADNTRHINKSYTISSADTWEKKTITFDGDTTGALGNDNAVSLIVGFWLGAGSNYTSGSLQTSWGSNTAANRAVGQVNLADSTSNEWYITGVQLEAGTSASDFEFLPFDANIRRCQRYYYVIADRRGVANPAIDQRAIGVGITHYVNQMVCEISLPTQMRTHPSYDQITGTDYFDYYHDQGSDYFDSFVGFAQQGRQKVMIRNTNQISADLDTCGQVFIASTSAFAALDAEL